MKKSERHALLKELIKEKNIQKQEEFVELLQKRGIHVTQATISRDMKELQLVKVPNPVGGYKYDLPSTLNEEAIQKLTRMMTDSFKKMDAQKEFLLIRTLPGNAMALGTILEEMDFEEVFGVISGDDTVLVICKGDKQTAQLQRKLLQYI